MMQLTPQMRILVSVEPTDFRAGIDGLCRVPRRAVRRAIRRNGLCFSKSHRTAIELLAYDGQGFWLCQKRLLAGHFRYWPGRDGSVQHELLAHELQVLLMAGDPAATRALPARRPITTAGIDFDRDRI